MATKNLTIGGFSLLWVTRGSDHLYADMADQLNELASRLESSRAR